MDGRTPGTTLSDARDLTLVRSRLLSPDIGPLVEDKFMIMDDLRDVREAIITSRRFPIIDNAVFTMHFATSAILMAFWCMLTVSMFFGKPINCYDPSTPVLGVSKVVEEYCLQQKYFTLPGKISTNVDKKGDHSENNETFTLPGNLSTHVDKVVSHPESNRTFNVLGNISTYVDKVGTHSAIDTSEDDEEEIHPNYSELLGVALLIQTVTFLLPYMLWIKLEGGKLQSLVSDLSLLPLSKRNRRANMNEIIDNYLRGLYNHKLYIVKCFICEGLNFINVFSQILVMGSVLGWKASTYGLALVNFFGTKSEYRDDPMVKVFPKTISCPYSGDAQEHDFLCNLPISTFNEMISALMWFWFVFLAILSGIQIVYRVLTIVFPQVRHFLLKTQAWHVADYDLNTVLTGAQPSEWFFLYKLNKNIDYLCFQDFIESLAKRMDSFSSETALLNSAKV